MSSIAESRAGFPVVVHMLLQRPAIGLDPLHPPELLLLRRANTGFMDGFFSLPGGHVEPGELPMEALRREVHEEAGVTVDKVTPLLVLPYRSGGHLGYNFVFTSSRWQGQTHIAEPQTADLLCWVPMDALPKPYPPWMDQVVERQLAAQGAWYQELDYARERRVEK